MPGLLERLDKKKAKDVKVLAHFVSIFCRENHSQHPKSIFPVRDAAVRRTLGSKNLVLCPQCRKLLHHGIVKRLQCPYDPKPMCKKCQTHCYAPDYREKMREVMRFSGLYLVRHGRLDLMFHYLF